MRRALLLTASLLCFSCLAGCGSIGQAREMIGGLYEKYEVVQQGLNAVQGEQNAVSARVEELHGALDADGDGKVDLSERLANVKDVAMSAAAGNQEDIDLLKNPYYWLTLVLGGPAAGGLLGGAARTVKKNIINPTPNDGTPS